MDLIAALRAYLIEDNCFFSTEERPTSEGGAYFLTWDCTTEHLREIWLVEDWSQGLPEYRAGLAVGGTHMKCDDEAGDYLATLATWQLEPTAYPSPEMLMKIVESHGDCIDIWQFDAQGRRLSDETDS